MAYVISHTVFGDDPQYLFLRCFTRYYDVLEFVDEVWDVAQKSGLSRVYIQNTETVVDHEKGRQVLRGLRLRGLEVVLIDSHVPHREAVERHFGPIHTYFATWQEAVFEGRRIPHFVDMIERMKAIDLKIREEESYRSQYPWICKVDRVTYEVHPRVGEIWGEPHENTRRHEHLVLLLDTTTATGVLVGKQYFVVRVLLKPGCPLEDMLERWGPWNLHVGAADSNGVLVLYHEPGKWRIAPHPALDAGNPNLRYIPMRDRIERFVGS